MHLVGRGEVLSAGKAAGEVRVGLGKARGERRMLVVDIRAISGLDPGLDLESLPRDARPRREGRRRW